MNMKSIRTVFLFVVLGVMTILLLGQTIISTYQITSGMEVEVKRMVVAKAGEVSNSFLGRINEAAEKADAMTLNLKSINNGSSTFLPLSLTEPRARGFNKHT